MEITERLKGLLGKGATDNLPQLIEMAERCLLARGLEPILTPGQGERGYFRAWRDPTQEEKEGIVSSAEGVRLTDVRAEAAADALEALHVSPAVEEKPKAKKRK